MKKILLSIFIYCCVFNVIFAKPKSKTSNKIILSEEDQILLQAKTYLDNYELELAERTYDAAVKKFPNSEKVLISVIDSYYHREVSSADFVKMFEYHEKLISLAPENDAYYRFMADTYWYYQYADDFFGMPYQVTFDPPIFVKDFSEITDAIINEKGKKGKDYSNIEKAIDLYNKANSINESWQNYFGLAIVYRDFGNVVVDNYYEADGGFYVSAINRLANGFFTEKFQKYLNKSMEIKANPLAQYQIFKNFSSDYDIALENLNKTRNILKTWKSSDTIFGFEDFFSITQDSLNSEEAQLPYYY